MSYHCMGGFTLLEVMIVVALIAILATLALPSKVGQYNQAKIVETIELVDHYKGVIEVFYRSTGNFPRDNQELGLPQPNEIVGNYLEGMLLEDGVMHLSLGQKLPQLKGQIISIRPVYVAGSPLSPISWVCGYDAIPQGMIAAGQNRSTVEVSTLPGRCR